MKFSPLLRFVAMVCGLTAIGLAVPSAAEAEGTYPDRPIRVVIGYPPGGGTDILARRLFAYIGPKMGWTLIIDNKPGATGVIATQEVAKAKPDGYTLLMGHIAPNAINPGDFLVPRVPVDWQLAPVAMGAIAPSLLLVRADLGLKTVAELRTWIKAQPRVDFGSDGVGSLAHLQADLFLSGLRTDAVHIAYKGGAPALTALLSGDVPFLFSPAPVALPHMNSGKVRALALTSSKRLSVLPNVPTMAEAGLTALDAPLWWGLFAPIGTPLAIIAKWNVAMDAAVHDPEIVQWMNVNGYAPRPMSPDVFGAYVASEQMRWSKITGKW